MIKKNIEGQFEMSKSQNIVVEISPVNWNKAIYSPVFFYVIHISLHKNNSLIVNIHEWNAYLLKC